MKKHLALFLAVFTILTNLPNAIAFAEETTEAPEKKFSDADTVKQIVQEQMQAIRKGDFEQAYKTFTSRDFKEITSQEDFEKFVKNFPVLLENKKLEIKNIYVENDIPTLKGVLTAANGETLKVEYDLVQEDGSWKIMGMQLSK